MWRARGCESVPVPTPIWILVVITQTALLALTSTFWLVGRRRTRHLRHRVRSLEEARPTARAMAGQSRSRRLVPRPDEAVRAVWETATLVRDKGVATALRTSVMDLAGWAQVELPDLVELAGADGLVTILFSDIEGSTTMNELLGDRTWVGLLQVHDRTVRRQVDKHDGRIVKSQGDGFMIAFADPEAAVRCAIGVQRALDRGRRTGPASKVAILVRVGIHQGSVVHRDNDIFGRNVAQAARVAALAEGGQILVSETVATAVAGCEDLVLGERRLVELKGLSGEHLLAAVDWRA
jgi:adenylate cyclase